MKIPHSQLLSSGPILGWEFSYVDIIGKSPADFTVRFVGDTNDAEGLSSIHLIEAVVDSLIVHDMA